MSIEGAGDAALQQWLIKYSISTKSLMAGRFLCKAAVGMKCSGSFPKMCDALHYLLDNIFIRFGSKLYRQIVGIPMGTNCAPLVADLFLFCYERDFMLSLSDINQSDVVEAFNSTSRYLDDLLNIDNPYFEQMVGQIYPTELQLNKANSSDTKAPFLDLNLSITNGIVSSKIYDKRDDFNFEIVNFLMEMFLALLPMVYIFLSLFVLLEYVLMLMTSTTETYF